MTAAGRQHARVRSHVLLDAGTLERLSRIAELNSRSLAGEIRFALKTYVVLIEHKNGTKTAHPGLTDSGTAA